MLLQRHSILRIISTNITPPAQHVKHVQHVQNMMPMNPCTGAVFFVVSFAIAFLIAMRKINRFQYNKKNIGNHHFSKDPRLIRPAPTTAIVGAGVVGLCTAYHLAKANHQRDAAQLHRVIVVEAAGKEFAATSRTNTGILTDTCSNEDLLPLTQYSYRLWEGLGKDTKFREKCGYREGVNFSLKRGSGIGQNLVPDWVCADAEWDVMKDPDYGRIAIINPVALGKWLYKECLRYGVEFRVGTQAVHADLSDSNQLISLDLASDSEKRTTLRADNLVLAAGPWTPALFKTLFPSSSVDMKPVIDAGDWIVFKNPKPRSAKSVAAVYLDDIVGEKLEFAGRNDHTIWATGERSRIGKVPLLGETPEPDQRNLVKLLANANVFLKHGQGDNSGLKVVSLGRSYRPTTQNGLPLIGGVPPERLSPGGSIWSVNSTRKSVYVNFGHGSHGLLLGMGSGKLMSQMLRCEKTDIDLPNMDLLW